MKRSTNGLAQFGEVALAIAAVGVVAMVIVPLPTMLLDLLICLNLSIAVVLMLISFYVPGALRLSSFPAILLLTTLFRLALNVSSTRLILLDADAGAVIDAFGEFVVQGNYLVGAVVFAILTVVQFIVIARGAERISEVAARFTLDAMPGKQLAIDADLRSEAITLEEARRRRQALEREAQLFGAMDGAMKFVKGDAIAAIVIIGINVVAGIVVGVVQLGMSFEQALQTYTLLTVGDGLVSQIPALLIATSAGIIVTRVAGDDERPLGEEIAQQISEHPRALGIAVVLLIVLAVIPGLPGLPFAIAAAAVGFVAWASRRHSAGEQTSVLTATGLAVPAIHRLELHMSEALSAQAEDQRGRFRAELRRMREEIALDLGVELPPVRLRVRDAGRTRFKVLVDEVPVFDGDVQGADDALELIVREATAVLRRHASEFVDLQSTQTMLDRIRDEAPAMVAETIPHVLTVTQLTDVLRRLVAEDVSIRNLPRILGLAAELGAGPHDTTLVVDVVREGLGAYLTNRFADASRALRYFEIDRDLEDMVVGAARLSGSRPYVALQPELKAEIIDGIREQTSKAHGRAVLVTRQSARAYLHSLIQHDLPRHVVMARQEIAPNHESERVGWIRI